MKIKSYGLITPTGTHIVENLINFDTYPLDPLEMIHLKIMWNHYLQKEWDICETGAQRIIDAYGYLVSQDWLEATLRA